MAVINVTTVEQFLTAFTQAVASGDTEDVIEIMTDIDFNTAPLTQGYTAGGKKIINGNYHSLSNISTQNVVNDTLFKYLDRNEIIWNKVNFLNLYRNENYNIFIGNSISQNYYQKFNDCTFQGKGYRMARYAVFTRCAVTWQNTQAISNAFTDCLFSYCWISCDIVSAGGSAFDFEQLDTCYVEGKITPATGVTDGWHICRGLENSVINVETTLNYSRGISGAGTISTVTVYNTTKMTGTITGQNNIVPVSDSQMKDAAALAAVGFNIIV